MSAPARPFCTKLPSPPARSSRSTRWCTRGPEVPPGLFVPYPATDVADRSPEPAGKNVRDVVSHRLVELSVAARGRLAVRAPAHELGDVPEPESLQVVVADLDHPLRPERDEGQLLVWIPPAALSAACGARFLGRSAPWMIGEVGDQPLQHDRSEIYAETLTALTPRGSGRWRCSSSTAVPTARSPSG